MSAIAQAPLVVDPIPTKKSRSRKALKQTNPSTNEANILAGSVSESSLVLPPQEDSIEKENHESLSNNKSPKKSKKSKVKAKKSTNLSLEEELLAMQEKLQQLTLEKEQTEEMLKEKDEMLKKKEEEEEKLHLELKKLQKAKEFKPTFSIPGMQSLKEKEQEKKGNNSRKKPSPAYVLWCKDQWTEVKKSNPEADFKEVSTLLGAKWKTVSAEEKKPYEERYQAEKEAYLKIVGNERREHEAMKLLEEDQKQKTAMELLEQYTQFVQETDKAIKKKSKKEKDESKPKHPMPAFFLFSNERRASLLAENNNVREIAKIAGEEWRNMTEEQKAPYEEMGMKNREQYAEEMKVYKQKKEEEVADVKREDEVLMKLQKQEALQLLKKKEKTEILIKKTKENQKKEKKEKKNNDPNKPKRPASSFILFSKEERKNVLKEHPEFNNSTVTAHISLKWKELCEEEKQKWNAKAAVTMEAYKKEMAEYSLSAAPESSQGSN